MAAIEREVGADGAVEARLGWAIRDRDDAVDGQIEGLAVDGTRARRAGWS